MPRPSANTWGSMLESTSAYNEVNVNSNELNEQDRGGGGHSTFSGRGVWPGFLKCGACELIFASEKGACELKISKFGGLRAKIWLKIEAVEAKMSKFSQKGSCELTLLPGSFAWNGNLASGRRGVKRGSSGEHIPYPLSRSVPPGTKIWVIIFFA